MIRRPPRSTLDRSSAASDVYKRQTEVGIAISLLKNLKKDTQYFIVETGAYRKGEIQPDSYTHLRAHETVLDLVCRLLLEQNNQLTTNTLIYKIENQRSKYQASLILSNTPSAEAHR
mgnify:CR=1 FL=1